MQLVNVLFDQRVSLIPFLRQGVLQLHDFVSEVVVFFGVHDGPSGYSFIMIPKNFTMNGKTTDQKPTFTKSTTAPNDGSTLLIIDYFPIMIGYGKN